MKTVLLATLIGSLGMGMILAGCEEKESPKPAPATGGSATGATDAAAKAMGDAARSAGAAADKAVDATKHAAADAKAKVMDAVKPQIDALKAKVESLTKGAPSVKMEQQPAYAKDVSEITSSMSGVTEQWNKFKDAAGDQWKLAGDDLKAQVSALTEKVNAAMTKYGIK